MFEQYLNPKTIINFIKNTTDYKKLALNLINSEQAKEFISMQLGLDYKDFKDNLAMVFATTKRSDIGQKRQQNIEQGQKLQIYKELASSLIKEDGLSVYSAIILSAGFVGIDQNKVVEFLSNKGYSATKQRIENYYKANEGFLKSLMKRKGKVIPNWNDTIQSRDLDLDVSENKTDTLVEVPNTPIQEQLGVEE